MHRPFRAAYNASYTSALWRRQTELLEGRIGTKASFRLAETPVFLSPEVSRRLEDAARGITALLERPGTVDTMRGAIPPEWDVPGMDSFPSFLQIDFALVDDGAGSLEPKLIELQGFPSLSAFEVFQVEAWSEVLQEVPGLPKGPWSGFFSGLDRARYVELLRRVVVADHDPERVVLLDLDPPKQKTFIDFEATRLLLGVDSVDPRSLKLEGRRLTREKGGRRVPVERIYNRIVIDELLRTRAHLPFRLTEEIDVSWTPHPNWYWTFSKASLPHLDHPAVPRTRLLSEVDPLPGDLAERYILKPLFSFAGGGVNVDPTPADVARIPAKERDRWCLQEKIAYAPFLPAVDGGGVKVEIRMMFYRPAGSPEPILGLNLCRLSRGKMLGVDFNKDFTWVGSSVAIAPAG